MIVEGDRVVVTATGDRGIVTGEGYSTEPPGSAFHDRVLNIKLDENDLFEVSVGELAIRLEEVPS